MNINILLYNLQIFSQLMTNYADILFSLDVAKEYENVI